LAEQVVLSASSLTGYTIPQLEAIERACRFWAKVDQNGPIVRPELGPCWLWTASRGADGYGQFERGLRAHRVAWETENGPIPDGLGILHKCDTPLCVRPSHLFTGTQKENSHDMVRKGRSPRGKLDIAEREMVRETVSMGTSQASMARTLGVHKQTIWRIVNRKGVI
jgi:HNH endonuclease